MSLWEIKVSVDPDQEERVDEFLAELEESSWHLFQERWARQLFLTGYFASREEAAAAWEQVRRHLPEGVTHGDPAFQEMEDADWQEAYRHHFQAWHFDGLHWVPVWERETFQVPEGEEVVWLDPGMAFGTGNHETTRLCVERLVEWIRCWRESGRDPASAEVIDAGCGSGILAISAAKCGCRRVAAFDLDPLAVQVSQENAELNELAGKIDFYQEDLAGGLAGRTGDLILANIQADVLCANAEELWRSVKPGGCLVLSGILAQEREDVRRHFARVARGASIDSRELGEWADLLLIRD